MLESCTWTHDLPLWSPEKSGLRLYYWQDITLQISLANSQTNQASCHTGGSFFPFLQLLSRFANVAWLAELALKLGWIGEENPLLTHFMEIRQPGMGPIYGHWPDMVVIQNWANLGKDQCDVFVLAFETLRLRPSLCRFWDGSLAVQSITAALEAETLYANSGLGLNINTLDPHCIQAAAVMFPF